LTYSILVAEKSTSSGDDGGWDCQARITSASGLYEPLTRIPKILREILHELPPGGHVGIFLSHAYTNSGLMACSLKGPDKLLHDYLLEQGVPVSLVPVVSSYAFERYDDEYCDYGDNDNDPPEFPVRLIHGFSDPRLEAHKSISTDMPFVSGWPVKGVCVKNEDTPCAHTGNEVEPHSVEKIYIKGAMIVGPGPVLMESEAGDGMEACGEEQLVEVEK
jgi:hypothetical protein